MKLSIKLLITREIGDITCNVITTSDHQEVAAHVTCDKRIYNEGGDTDCSRVKTDVHPQVLPVSEIENEKLINQGQTTLRNVVISY